MENVTLQRRKKSEMKGKEGVFDQSIHRLTSLPKISMNRTIWPCQYCLDDVKYGNRVQHLITVCEAIPAEHKLKIISSAPEKRQQMITMLEFPFLIT